EQHLDNWHRGLGLAYANECVMLQCTNHLSDSLSVVSYLQHSFRQEHLDFMKN
ncbi:mCG146155, partial [Mus musculus]